jgi:hypothetical protein
MRWHWDSVFQRLPFRCCFSPRTCFTSSFPATSTLLELYCPTGSRLTCALHSSIPRLLTLTRLEAGPRYILLLLLHLRLELELVLSPSFHLRDAQRPGCRCPSAHTHPALALRSPATALPPDRPPISSPRRDTPSTFQRLPPPDPSCIPIINKHTCLLLSHDPCSQRLSYSIKMHSRACLKIRWSRCSKWITVRETWTVHALSGALD